MTKLQEAELRDIVDLLYKFITDHTKLFDTMAAGKPIYSGTGYKSDIKALAEKAKVCYAHPGSDGFLHNGSPVTLDNFKLRLFGLLEEKFGKEFPKKVRGSESQFKRLFDISFIKLGGDTDLGCVFSIEAIFGNRFSSRAKAIIEASHEEKKAVNESFEKIYNRFN